MKSIKKIYFATLWIFGYLILFDIAINVAFKYPKDPENRSPSKPAQFFEYGRSIEGKLTRMTRKTIDQSARRISWGWIIEPEIRYFSDLRDSASHPTVTFYGMSHSVYLAEDLAKLDDSFVVRSLGAPGAVPTWAYAAYLSDKELLHSDVVVLSIMTRGVALICTTSGTTNHFDSVCPYTYPRYYLSGGILASSSPPFLSAESYLEYFYHPENWNSYKNWLKQNDKYYNPLLFQKTILDNSSIIRMLRRAYAFSSQRKKEARVYDNRNGFKVSSEEVEILKSIIVSFSEDAKRNNSLPILYLINNVSMGDHLYRVLEPTLAAHDILFLSSHVICPPNDPTNFDSTQHFIAPKNVLLAKAMVNLIKKNIKLD